MARLSDDPDVALGSPIEVDRSLRGDFAAEVHPVTEPNTRKRTALLDLFGT